MVLILNMNFDKVSDKNYGMKLLQLIAVPVWVLPISQFPTNTTIRGYYSSTSKKSFPQEPVFCLETTTLSGWFSKSNNWKICFKPQKVDKRSYIFWSVIWREAALHCSHKKLFWKYAANLQESTHAELWFE